jgi:hypothetical protein
MVFVSWLLLVNDEFKHGFDFPPKMHCDHLSTPCSMIPHLVETFEVGKFLHFQTPTMIAAVTVDKKRSFKLQFALESTTWSTLLVLLVQHLLLEPILQGTHIRIDSLVEFECVGDNFDR